METSGSHLCNRLDRGRLHHIETGDFGATERQVFGAQAPPGNSLPPGCARDPVRSSLPRLLLENPLHNAGADAELSADLENAVTVGPQFSYLRFHGRLDPTTP
jgi:hypothetical protein